MKTSEIVLLFVILVIILALVFITANLDLLFPTPSPMSFAKTAVNATGV